MVKNDTLQLKEKITIGVTVIGLLVGYGRRAYAVCTGGPANYVCSGATTTSQNLGAIGPITVTTTSDFTLNVTSGTALHLMANGAPGLYFTNNYSNAFITGETGIYAANDGTGSVLSITTQGDVTGTNGAGIYALNTITGTDLIINAVNVSGTTYGIQAKEEGTGQLSIHTSGDVTASAGTGIYAYTSGGDDLMVYAQNVSGTSYGIRVNNNNFVGSSNITTNGEVVGTNGIGIFTTAIFTPTTITVNSNSVVKGSVAAISASANYATGIINHGLIENLSTLYADQAIVVPSGSNTATISNYGVITGTVNLTNSGNNNFSNNTSSVWNTTGTSYFGSGSNTLTNGAGALIQAASSVDNTAVVTQFNGLTNFNNAGTISTRNQVVGNQLVITGQFTGSGASQLLLNTVLGDDNSLTDQLVLNTGASATGATAVMVQNVGGAGAQTVGDGIKVIDASTHNATTTADAFNLGNRVASGAYEYKLYQGGIGADASLQDWFLRSGSDSGAGVDDGGGGVSIPRVEVPLATTVPVLAQQLGLNMLSTLDDRLGNKFVDVQATATSGYWARVLGQSGHRNNGNDYSNFNNFGPSYHWNIEGVQLGFDLIRQSKENNNNVIGIDFGYGRANASVATVNSRAGDLSMNSYSLAANWTYYAIKNWYTDTVAQVTDYNQIQTNSVSQSSLALHGLGYLFSVETGWKLNYRRHFAFTPEAQIIYQSVNVASGADNFGRFNFQPVDVFYARVGGKLSRDWSVGRFSNPVTTWARASVWSDFNAHANTIVSSTLGENPVTFGNIVGGNWTQLGIGVAAKTNHGFSLFTSADVSHFVGGTQGYFWSGSIGAKYVC